MANLKNIIDKATFLLIVGVWNAVSLFVSHRVNLDPEIVALVVTIGNLIIGWLGLEAGVTINASASKS
jgi:hypothetical protein